MSDGILIAEKYECLELGAGEVRWDGCEIDAFPKVQFGASDEVNDWYSIQQGFWQQIMLIRVPCTCEVSELELDLKLLLSWSHRMEVTVSANKQNADAYSRTGLAGKRVSVYHSRVVRPCHEETFVGQVYVNIDPLVISKEQNLELTLELRSQVLPEEEAVAKLLIELCAMGKKNSFLFQLMNLSSVALQA